MRTKPFPAPGQTYNAELETLRQQLVGQPYKPLGPLVASLALALKQHTRARAEAQRLIELTFTDATMGVFLKNSDYPFFVRNLLKKASESIRIILFFMRFEHKAKYPTDELLEIIVRQFRRGLDVRVILDRDAEGQAIRSRIINAEAYQYFRDEGVPVTYDSTDRYTHTKLVIVDRRHVVIGSHNWTAGSFLNYDDTSVCIDSEQLGAYYSNQFEKLWKEYTGRKKASKRRHSTRTGPRLPDV